MRCRWGGGAGREEIIVTQRDIVYVLRFFPEPSETFIRREIRGLLSAGVPVTVLAVDRSPGSDGSDPAGRTNQPLPAVHYLRGATRGEHEPPAVGRTSSAALRLLATVCRDVARLGLRPRPSGRCLRLALDALRGRRLVPVTARRLHAHFANDAAVLARYLSILSGIPYAVTAHAYDIYQDPFLLRPNLAAAAAVYTVSRANLRFLLATDDAKSWDEGRFSILRCGIDLDEFAYRDPSPPASPSRLLCPARLVPKKGHAVLIEAVRQLKEAGTPVELTLAGDGPLRESLRAQVADSGLADAVKLLGTVESARVRRLMLESDLVAIASRVAEDGDRDGLPVALIEAAALGVPMVSTDVSGIPELVTRDNGWLVPPDRPDRLAEAVRAALAEPHDARVARARVARRAVENHFSLSTQVDILRQL
jgi:glycosyltransferase involved in cell wall biosynthesis